MFAALGAEARLDLFVRLLRSGPAGLSSAEIENPQALDDLRRAGLARAQKVGRTEIFHADAEGLIQSLDGLLGARRDPEMLAR
jgi:hypothetical protein